MKNKFFILCVLALVLFGFAHKSYAGPACAIGSGSNLADLIYNKDCTVLYYDSDSPLTIYLSASLSIEEPVVIYGNGKLTISTKTGIPVSDYLLKLYENKIVIDQTIFDCNGKNGIKILSNANTISNSQFKNCGTAIYAKGTTDDNLFDENLFSNISQKAISLEAGANNDVSKPLILTATPLNSSKWLFSGKIFTAGITSFSVYYADETKISVPQGLKFLMNVPKFKMVEDASSTIFNMEMETAPAFDGTIPFDPSRYYTILATKGISNTSEFSSVYKPGIKDTGMDIDADDVINVKDNCPNEYNPEQENMDQDTLGDECDDDIDGDTVMNDEDNCPIDSNIKQVDIDSDDLGDLCDDDIDGDKFANEDDNCPYDNNPNQLDTNHDGFGDVCDGDTGDADKDGVPNYMDNCEKAPNAKQEDYDDDGMGDVCDEDMDADSVKNIYDNCPFVANPTQADNDDDEDGDACDSDLDGDGVDNDSDNCLEIYNPVQIDKDNDDLGDDCDPQFSGSKPPSGGDEETPTVSSLVNPYLDGLTGFYAGVGGGACTLIESNDSVSFVSIIMLLIAVSVLLIVRKINTFKKASLYITMLVVVLLSGKAYALNSHIFVPVTDQFSTIRTFGSKATPQWHINFGLYEGVARDPFEYRNFSTTSQISGIIDILTTTDIFMDMGFHDRFSMGVNFPIHYGKFSNPNTNTSTYKGEPGDMRVHAKISILPVEKYHFGIALIPFADIPTGSLSYVVGDKYVNGGALIAIDGELGSSIYVTANVGYREHGKREIVYGPTATARALDIKHELLYSFGTAIAIIQDKLLLVGDITGSAALHEYGFQEGECPIDVVGAFRGNLKNLQWNLGGGAGITGGYGDPEFRVFGGISYLVSLL